MEFITLPVLVDRFVNYLKNQGKSNLTLVAYKKDLQQFVGFLTSKQKDDVREVNKDDISLFINQLIEKNYTKKSASRKLNSIRSFFRFLKKEGVINQNPALEVNHPKYSLSPPRILSELEYRALRDAARDDVRSYAMIELLLQTGIKIGELVNIRNKDINDKENFLYIRPYGKTPERKVPLNNAAKKALSRYLKTKTVSSPDDFLFITRTGKPILIRNIRQIITRYFNEVGIEKATVNDLRNTFIAHQLTSGTPVEYVAKIVGHLRLSSTERYLKLVKEKQSKKERINEL